MTLTLHKEKAMTNEKEKHRYTHPSKNTTGFLTDLWERRQDNMVKRTRNKIYITPEELN